MKVIEYFTCENQAHWLERIGRSDWGAGQFLYSLLREGKLKETVGQTALPPARPRPCSSEPTGRRPSSGCRMRFTPCTILKRPSRFWGSLSREV